MKPFQHVHLSFKCPVSMGELQPCNGGFYCKGCHKIVRDLRGKTEEEVIAAFAAAGNKMCGMFEADRVSFRAPKWHKWVSAALFCFGLAGWFRILAGDDKYVAGKILTGVVLVDINRTHFAFNGQELADRLKSQINYDVTCKHGKMLLIKARLDKSGNVARVRIVKGIVSDSVAAQLTNAVKNTPIDLFKGQQRDKQGRIMIPVTL